VGVGRRVGEEGVDDGGALLAGRAGDEDLADRHVGRGWNVPKVEVWLRRGMMGESDGLGLQLGLCIDGDCAWVSMEIVVVYRWRE